ncbi:MAG TPA: TIGR00159 family protein [Bacteroidetes bacterium]|nr:TIGR00159 family protein [Bacteroidota bacterium]HEX05273.1 TIGR00159 family protein [Bacteroidota bacterium]
MDHGFYWFLQPIAYSPGPVPFYSGVSVELFRIGFLSVGLVDIVDIALVAYIFYKLYAVMRGTRGSQMVIGLLMIFIASILVGALGLKATTWLAESVAQVWVIAFVILFQPELRRLMVQIGQTRFVQRLLRVKGTRTIEAIVVAAVALSEKRYGGLFVIQRDIGLRGIIETGVKMQSEVSSELLVSLFFPRTPLHDGAVVISGNLIEAAACILPLTENPNIDASIGTRHRAALGVSEESDAATVVVSEETGQISIAYRGEFLERGISGDELRSHLQRILERVSEEPSI